MKKIISILVCASAGLLALAQTVSSPNGKLVVTVSCDGGQPAYEVALDGVTFIERSPLGMRTNAGDFSQGLTCEGQSTWQRISEDYSVKTIKQSQVHYEANRSVFSFSKDGRAAFDVEFQVSDRDVAFRYEVKPQGETLCCVVQDEATGFRLPAGTTSFLSCMSGPMGGFARTSPSYEKPYDLDAAPNYNGWDSQGYVFPCLFKNADKGWVLISETGTRGDYCGCRLLYAGAEGQYKVGFPQEGEFNGNGTACPGISLPGRTPWRTITVGSTLANVTETTVAWDVVKPLYEPTKEYQYGSGSWSWVIVGDDGVTYETTKQYIDFTAAMGWQTTLVDNYWDTLIGREGIAELAAYGKAKGVDLYLWYNTNGYWNDAPQTPRNIMNNIITRRRELAWLRQIGVRGIKVDFIGSDKQVALQLLEDILVDANEYGIMVIFHGCTIPRGWERMYPNFVSSEAALVSENLHFSQDFCNEEAKNATIHPFSRNALGAMDFGGSTLNKYWNPINSPEMWGGVRQTSDAFALATAVLFQSPAQHWAMTPTNLYDAPAWAVDFMKTVPTLWDEVRYIDGYPGRYAVLARRSGSRWYIAGVAAQDYTATIDLAPYFAPGTEVTVYEDAAPRTVKVNKKQTIKVTIPCNGGLVIAGD